MKFSGSCITNRKKRYNYAFDVLYSKHAKESVMNFINSRGLRVVPYGNHDNYQDKTKYFQSLIRHLVIC
jgi:hypothetical protein